MTKEDLYGYSIEKENVGGIYWQFLELSKEDLKAMDVDITHFSGILKMISNDILRDKMKVKFIELLKDQSIYTIETLMDRGGYTEDERERAFKTKIEELFENNLETIHDVERIVIAIDYVQDKTWREKKLDELVRATDKMLEYCVVNGYRNLSGVNSTRLNIIRACVNKDDAKYFYEAWESHFSDYEKAIAKHYYENDYLQNKAKTYMESEVLISVDPNIKIGLEIELNHKEDKSISILSEQIGYQNWKEDYEATVPGGFEFKSPVLHDTFEDMSRLKAVFEGLTEAGYYAEKSLEFNTNTSSQINIGLDYLDTAESIMCFFELYGNAEEVLYHICNPDGEFIRQEIASSSRFKPVSPVLGTKIIPEDVTREEVLDLFASIYDGGKNNQMIYKKMSVCIRDAKDVSTARLEFRMSNGSNDFDVWRQNIKLYAKLVECAKTISRIRKKYDISPDEEMKLLLFEQLRDEESTLEDKLEILMNLLFDDEQDRQVYVDRFYKLEENIRLHPNTRYIYSSSDTTDFQGIYRPKSYSIEYDPDTDEYIENDENDRN